MEAFCHALCDTGRLQSLIHSILAVVTLNDRARIWIPLGGTPGAGRNADLAANTTRSIDEDDAILWPFLHGACGANGDTGWALTVKAGDKHIGHARQIVHQIRPNGDDLTEPGTDGQNVLCLAVGLTTEASNAALGIMIDIVFTH